jgi:hypothetical protein
MGGVVALDLKTFKSLPISDVPDAMGSLFHLCIYGKIDSIQHFDFGCKNGMQVTGHH